MKRSKRIFPVLLAAVLLLGITPAYAVSTDAGAGSSYAGIPPGLAAIATDPGNIPTFDDVKPGDWYYDAVMALTANGILKGYGNGKFGPNDPLTYQQLWTILSRICNTGESYSSFGNDAWSTKTVDRGGAAYTMTCSCWASPTYANSYYDIVHTTNWNNVKAGTFIRSVDSFPDAAAIKTWSVNYATAFLNDHPYDMDSVSNMANTLQGGVVKGYNYDFFKGMDSAGTFSPGTDLTRAQLCQALYRAGLTDVVP